MINIESEVTVGRPVDEVYALLENMNNHQQLMPSNIYNWESTENEASFTIQNMAKLALKISSKVQNKQIIAVPSEKAPFEIELKWSVSSNDSHTTQARLTISADLNPMMKMLASTPLQKLANHQTEKLAQIMA
ncbi:carbon monoxide dehydrogenase subunit G [Pedobacter sp. UYEF25]